MTTFITHFMALVGCYHVGSHFFGGIYLAHYIFKRRALIIFTRFSEDNLPPMELVQKIKDETRNGFRVGGLSVCVIYFYFIIL